jgi:formamidopyrimidine-DNA glycosylase
MPELPEVESVRRLMTRVLRGQRIVEVEVVPDEIVLGGVDPAAFRAAIEGRTLQSVGRKGKYWWLDFGEPPVVFGHLGMSGWIRELGQPTIRLKEHGNAPLDDESGRPRFLKLMMTVESGQRIAFTDGRRLARLWMGESPELDARVSKLGPDALDALPDDDGLYGILHRRKAPLKALLLDQKLFAGVGNWIADECLYQAGLAPKRTADTLTRDEVATLRTRLLEILEKAVDVNADKEQFPPDWLFHHRWDGHRGPDVIDGEPIVRETVGGRTTAWVPTRQR